MFFRVPLLFPSALVLHRLDIAGTAAIDPPGVPQVGYDPDFREPYQYDNSGSKADTRQYLAPVRIPCQIETPEWQEVRQQPQGDAPLTEMTFVVHRRDLLSLGLLNSSNTTLIKTNDKITAIEKHGSPGVVTLAYKQPLYVVEVRPGSWGMGSSGYDLELIIAENRPSLPST